MHLLFLLAGGPLPASMTRSSPGTGLGYGQQQGSPFGGEVPHIVYCVLYFVPCIMFSVPFYGEKNVGLPVDLV